MSTLRIDLEQAISGATTYEQAEEVSEQIMVNTQPPMQADKIWHKWERSLLTALVLHCSLGDDERPAFEIIHQYLLSPEFGRDEIVKDLTKPEEVDALERFESSLELAPSPNLTPKSVS